MTVHGKKLTVRIVIPAVVNKYVDLLKTSCNIPTMTFNLKYNRQEWSGAFGDIGTDFPLIIGMILASGLDATHILLVYGFMQILTGLIYQRPMPVQPLKAVAAIVITQKISGSVIFGGGLAIALIMLLLTATNTLNLISKHVPKCVVRGIQFGLGLNLALLAMKDYVSHDGVEGYLLALVSFFIILFLLPNKKIPVALIVLGLGIIYALIFKIKSSTIATNIVFSVPVFRIPTFDEMLSGLLILAIPQVPLSLGNSILATQQVNNDLFPNKPLTIKKIGFTYSLMNGIASCFGGVPVCHGSGGMMGHYTFGARTGGSLLIYGGMYILLGVLFSNNLTLIKSLFPLGILGVILLIESLALMILAKDLSEKNELWIALLVAVISCSVPNGFAVGLILGVLVYKIKLFIPGK